MEGLVRVLECIGTDTTRLDIEANNDEELSAEVLTSFLVACPELVELRLHGLKLESIAPIFDGYEARDSCLERLTLVNVVLPQNHYRDHVVAAMADETHPCRQYLHEIWVDNARETIPEHQALRLTHRFVKLLNLHPGLCCLTPVMAMNDFLGGQVVFNDEFHQVPGKPTTVREGPFPMTSKLAFLSLTRASTIAAMQSLTSEIVASVFQFAAPTKARKCAFYFDTRGTANRVVIDDDDDEQVAGEQLVANYRRFSHLLQLRTPPRSASSREIVFHVASSVPLFP